MRVLRRHERSTRDLAPTLAPKVVEEAEAEMLVWHERVSLATNARPEP